MKKTMTVLIIIGVAFCFLIVCCLVAFFAFDTYRIKDQLICEKQITEDLKLKISYHQSVETSRYDFEFKYRDDNWQKVFVKFSPDNNEDIQKYFGGNKTKKDYCDNFTVQEYDNVMIFGNVMYSYDKGRSIDSISNIPSYLNDQIEQIIEKNGIDDYYFSIKRSDLIFKSGRLEYTLIYDDLSDNDRVEIVLAKDSVSGRWYIVS